jgi:hypothetical protein
MKKIFTLVLTLGILSSAFSQKFVSRVSYSKPVFSVGFSHRYVETYSFAKYEKEMQIQKINRDFTLQVNTVMNMRISVSKKIELIQQLQKERAFKIQRVNDRFFDYRNKYNDMHYDRNFNWIR